MKARLCWLVTVIYLISCFHGHICWPTLQPQPFKDFKHEIDSDESRKVLGSSVVTSVSVITSHGNGTRTYHGDKYDNPQKMKSDIIGSPGNLLNPDRYEFYTFDETGDLIKRLMTWEEIQGLIAGGDPDGLLGDDSLPVLYSDSLPSEKNSLDVPHLMANDFQTSDIQGVHKVVESVQNVLKSELAASQGKFPLHAKPITNPPNWSLFLPGLIDEVGATGGGGNDFNHYPNFLQPQTDITSSTTQKIYTSPITKPSPHQDVTKNYQQKKTTEKPLRYKTTTQKSNKHPSTSTSVLFVTTTTNSSMITSTKIDEVSISSTPFSVPAPSSSTSPPSTTSSPSLSSTSTEKHANLTKPNSGYPKKPEKPIRPKTTTYKSPTTPKPSYGSYSNMNTTYFSDKHNQKYSTNFYTTNSNRLNATTTSSPFEENNNYSLISSSTPSTTLPTTETSTTTTKRYWTNQTPSSASFYGTKPYNYIYRYPTSSTQSPNEQFTSNLISSPFHKFSTFSPKFPTSLSLTSSTPSQLFNEYSSSNSVSQFNTYSSFPSKYSTVSAPIKNSSLITNNKYYSNSNLEGSFPSSSLTSIPTTKMYSTPTTAMQQELQASFSNVLHQVTDHTLTNNQPILLSEKPDSSESTKLNSEQIILQSTSSKPVPDISEHEKIAENFTTTNLLLFSNSNSTMNAGVATEKNNISSGLYSPSEQTTLSFSEPIKKPLAPLTVKPQSQKPLLESQSYTKVTRRPVTTRHTTSIPSSIFHSYSQFSTSNNNRKQTPNNRFTTISKTPVYNYDEDKFFTYTLLNKTSGAGIDPDKLVTEQYVSQKLTNAPEVTKFGTTSAVNTPGISAHKPGIIKYTTTTTDSNSSSEIETSSRTSITGSSLDTSSLITTTVGKWPYSSYTSGGSKTPTPELQNITSQKYTPTKFSKPTFSTIVTDSSGNNSSLIATTEGQWPFYSSYSIGGSKTPAPEQQNITSQKYTPTMFAKPTFSTSTTSSSLNNSSLIITTEGKRPYYSSYSTVGSITSAPELQNIISQKYTPTKFAKPTFSSSSLDNNSMITTTGSQWPSYSSYSTGGSKTPAPEQQNITSQKYTPTFAKPTFSKITTTTNSAVEESYTTIEDTMLQKLPTITPPSKNTIVPPTVPPPFYTRTPPTFIITPPSNSKLPPSSNSADIESLTQISIMLNQQQKHNENNIFSKIISSSTAAATAPSFASGGNLLNTSSASVTPTTPSIVTYEKIYSTNNEKAEDANNFIQNGISAVTNILLQTESRISNKDGIIESANGTDLLAIMTTESNEKFGDENFLNLTNSEEQMINKTNSEISTTEQLLTNQTFLLNSVVDQNSTSTIDQIDLTSKENFFNSSTSKINSVNQVSSTLPSNQIDSTKSNSNFSLSSSTSSKIFNSTTTPSNETTIITEDFTITTTDKYYDLPTTTSKLNNAPFYIPVNIINIADSINYTNNNRFNNISNENLISIAQISSTTSLPPGTIDNRFSEINITKNNSNNDDDINIDTTTTEIDKNEDRILTTITTEEILHKEKSTTEKWPPKIEFQGPSAPSPTSSFRVPGSSSSSTHSAVDLPSAPHEHMGMEATTAFLSDDVRRFVELCNELSFKIWTACTGKGAVNSRSLVLSPFAAIGTLAMIFLGARGSSSEQMNDLLQLDDMITFNPHQVLQNITESIVSTKNIGVASASFVREIYSDRSKGRILDFYKERVQQYYDAHVEEINFNSIGDLVRRRTNLLIRRQTTGRIQDYLRGSSLVLKPPLATLTANVFQTNCDIGSTEGRDGEMYFVVRPSNRQRRLVPIPAVVYRSGFLAGYEPSLDATAVTISPESIVSTILILPGQQGQVAPGDGLARLEQRLLETYYRRGSWSRLLRSLLHRPGLELQIPRFSHKSVSNLTLGLEKIGLDDIFNPEKADLKGINGLQNNLYLSDVVQVNTFSTCGEDVISAKHHVETYPSSPQRVGRFIRSLDDMAEDYVNNILYSNLPLNLRPRQARLPDIPRLRYDRPFLYMVRHNPTGMILFIGRFNPRLIP